MREKKWVLWEGERRMSICDREVCQMSRSRSYDPGRRASLSTRLILIAWTLQHRGKTCLCDVHDELGCLAPLQPFFLPHLVFSE